MMAEGAAADQEPGKDSGARTVGYWGRSRQTFRRMTAEAHARTWTHGATPPTCVCRDVSQSECVWCQAVRVAVEHSGEHRGPDVLARLPEETSAHHEADLAFTSWLNDQEQDQDHDDDHSHSHSQMGNGGFPDVSGDEVDALVRWAMAGPKAPRLTATLNIIYALMLTELGRSCADTAADERYARLWTLKMQIVAAPGGICDLLARTRLSGIDDLDFRRSSEGVAAELDRAVEQLDGKLPARALGKVAAITEIYRTLLTGSEAMAALGALALDGFDDQFRLAGRSNRSLALALFFMVYGFPMRCRLLVWTVATRAAPGFSLEKAILYEGEWDLDPARVAAYHEYLSWLEADGLLRYGGVPFSDIVACDTEVRSHRYPPDQQGLVRVEDALHPLDAPPCAEHGDPRHTACSWRWRDGWYEAMLALVSAGLNQDAADAGLLNGSPVNLWAMAAFDGMSMARRTREDSHYGTMTILGADVEDIGKVIGELLAHIRQGTELKDILLMHYGANMAAYDCLGFNTSYTATALTL